MKEDFMFKTSFLEMQGLWGAIIGTVLGFVLSLFPKLSDDKKRLRGCRATLRAEIKYCAELAHHYLESETQAPLYRLPMKAWQDAYSVLLSSGTLDENKVNALHKYYNATETFNRGLDEIDQVKDKPEKLDEMLKKLPSKAMNIGTGSDLYRSALQALEDVR
jgi:hypothetical protein